MEGLLSLTFADEALLGDGLLANVTALGLLEGLQLEGVRVDALQLVGLRGREEGRQIRGESTQPAANGNTFRGDTSLPAFDGIALFFSIPFFWEGVGGRG